MKKFMTESIVRMLCAAAETENPGAGTGCESADNFSNPNEALMKEIKAEEEEREKEEKKNAAKLQVQQDTYEQEQQAIELRYKRAVEKAQTKKLKARTEENNKYFAGGIDTDVHKKNIQEINNTYNKEENEADNERCKALRNLRTKNPEGYSRSRW